ncbi:MAG: 50S ribosomal protein L15 [Anaerolineae bacterium]
MKLHELREPEGTKGSRKRRGRGHAAGQGKTSGFGTKGQNSRAGRGGKLYFEGGQLPLVRRLAVRRGFTNVNRVEYAVVNVEMLNCFEEGTVVDPVLLVNAGLVRNLYLPIKILGAGDLTRPLTVEADRFSASAKAKIEAAGGSVKMAEG